jgi:hypothetical protein
VVVVTPAGQVDVDPALEALVKLFGAELGAKVWKREGIKLDPTVDRGLFREQRDRLKELGYRFDAKAQAWAVDRVTDRLSPCTLCPPRAGFPMVSSWEPIGKPVLTGAQTLRAAAAQAPRHLAPWSNPARAPVRRPGLHARTPRPGRQGAPCSKRCPARCSSPNPGGFPERFLSINKR